MGRTRWLQSALLPDPCSGGVTLRDHCRGRRAVFRIVRRNLFFATRTVFCREFTAEGSQRGSLPTPESRLATSCPWEVSTAAGGQLGLGFMEHAAEAGRPGCYLSGKFRLGNPVMTDAA